MKKWITGAMVMFSLAASAVDEETEFKSLTINSTGFIQVDAGEDNGDTIRRIRSLASGRTQASPPF